MNRSPALATLLCAALPAQDRIVWVDDFAKAKALAVEHDQDLLLDFTGSDWCGWCIKLRDEVFDTEAFAAPARERFVFVELDFPRRKELAAATRAQNERLAAEMGVQGYPTIFLADAEGRPYARTGYRPGGPAKYLAHLTELREARARRDAAWARATEASGVERARLLAAGLDALEPDLHRHYVAVMEDLVQAAGDDDVAKVWEPRLRAAKLSPKVDELRRSFTELAQQEKWADAGQAVAAFLAEHEVQGDVAGELHYLHGMALANGGDPAAALAAFERCKAASPKLGARLEGIIEQLRGQAKAEPGGETKKGG